MDRRSPPPPLQLLLFLLFSLVLLQLLWVSHASSTYAVRCPAAESDALMHFKQQLRDPLGRLSSWVGRDCCAWEGVACSNTTGHVVQLDLRNRYRSNFYKDCSDETSEYWRSDDDYGCRWALVGGISPPLLSLRHLRRLDLSGNFFQHNPIPEFLGSFSRLTYLNLSAAGFRGKVPDQLGNLSNLHQLDLSFNEMADDEVSIYGSLYIEKAGWISQLTSLRHLNLNRVSLGSASDRLGAIIALPHIRELRLSCSGIVSLFPPHNSLPSVNFTSLTALDLSFNSIDSSVQNWLLNITSLEQLDLSWTYLNWIDIASISKLTSLRVLDLTGNVLQNGLVPTAFHGLCNLQTLILGEVNISDEISYLQAVFSGCLILSLEELNLSHTGLKGYLPKWLWSMNNLKHLDLSHNALYGPLPISIGNLSSMQYLDLSDNALYGPLPVSIGNLSSMQYLNIGANQLNGTIVEGMFGHMSGLVELYLGGNSLIFSKVDLANLSMTLKCLDISCNTLVLDENYEDWIPPFQLEDLYMFSCRILPNMSQFPKWLTTQRVLSLLDLSNMGIKDTFPNWLPNSLEFLYLYNNKISGNLSQYLPNLQYLALSNNSFSGQLPSTINITMPNIKYLGLFNNNFTGTIPFSICQFKYLVALRLFKNIFSGNIPNCWDNSTKIKILDLSNNNLQGGIPKSLCNIQQLQSLYLSYNNLSGQILDSLKDCTRLIHLDLSYNHFCGRIPAWIGENLVYLNVLKLRSNDLTGNISPQLSSLEYLQVLDLSNNNLSETIPSSFGNFSTLKGDFIYYDSDGGQYSDTIQLFTKGSEHEYINFQPYTRSIDLSNNSLIGYIPPELENLNTLQSLNLSHNYLIGEIPREIGRMQKLEVIDLSRNNLSGPIPSSMASLNFLGTLDLSYNNLSGQIPTSTQLQGFNQSKYAGNPNLCGFPLPKSCTKGITKSDGQIQKEDTDGKTEIVWLSASIVLGFITGFWMIFGALISNRRWRFSFFKALDNTYDKLYVMVLMKMKEFRRE